MNTVETIVTAIPQPVYLKNYQVPDYLVDTIDLQFELDEETTLVKATTVFKKNIASQSTARCLILQGEELKLLSIQLNGQPLDKKNYQLSSKLLTLTDVPDQFTLTIHNEISPINNTELNGLYVSRHNFCTQCEPEGFRRITYYLDRPDVMGRFSTTIIADKKRYPILLSNGNPIDSGEMADGRHWAKWQDPFKKPSYLFALVAGDFECLERDFMTMSKRKVKLKIYVEKGNLDKSKFAMQAVEKAMRWDEEKYGREYDLDIYMIVAVSDFNFGAMENKGLNIFNTQYILTHPATATDQDYINVESVIAHEYFHNWTGNRITCRDWFQLSLKEGLTIFRDQSFTEDTTSRKSTVNHRVSSLRARQFVEDSGPLAHSVRPESYIEIENFYTSTVYQKGAEVIRMMKTLLGENKFREGMDLYFKRHDGCAVTIEDFVVSMEEASGVDLKQFRLWYSQAGTPFLAVSDKYNAAEKKYTLTVKQSCPATPGQPTKLPLEIPFKVALLDSCGKEMRNELLCIKKAEQQFEFLSISEKPIPSLLRNFSAPVKFSYPYSDDDLLFLFEQDTDAFNRWDAGQQYATQMMLKLIDDHHANKTLVVPEKYLVTLKNILSTQQQDQMYLTDLLVLPTEHDIAEQMVVIDIDAIHAVRNFVLFEIAKHLQDDFIEIYRLNNTKQPHFSMKAAGERCIKNLCLYYLTRLPRADIHQDYLLVQFTEALSSNMTDAIAALSLLADLDRVERKQAMDAFYQKWQHEDLVVNKWLSVQAGSLLSDTLEQVKRLTQHAAFDIKNPNNVYALIGAFSRNAVNFHRIDGEGYVFLADTVLRLDAFNPQVAARMVTPMTNWKRYDKRRQPLMKAQLERILKSEKLSKNVYELVQKSV
jgi:aminopeptidase N